MERRSVQERMRTLAGNLCQGPIRKLQRAATAPPSSVNHANMWYNRYGLSFLFSASAASFACKSLGGEK